MIEKIKTFCKKREARETGVILLAIYGGLSFCYIMNLAGFAAQKDSLGFTQSIFSILPFPIVWYFLKKISFTPKQLRYAMIFGALLGLSIVWGYQLRMLGYTLPGVKNKLGAIIAGVGLGVDFLPLTLKWFVFLDRKISAENKAGEGQKPAKKDIRTVFVCSWAGIFALWVPVFLAYFPAIMSYDFHRQSGEAFRGTIWFWAHHPVVHTYLIRIFLLLGERLGSYEAGMAAFSICQMLLVSFALAYSFAVIYEITGRKRWAYIPTVFFGIIPFSPVLALSITKDIPYAALMLIMIVEIYRIRNAADIKERILHIIILVIAGIPDIWLRNNAAYAFAAMIPFWIICEKGLKKKLTALAISAVILVGGIGGRSLIMKAFNAIPQNGKIEMLSVPMMQMGRVAIYQNANLSEESRRILSEYFKDVDMDEDTYYAPIADGMRDHTIGFDEVDDWGKFAKDWLYIGLRYPNDYIDAFLALTAGYWSPDDFTHAEMLGYGDDTNLGLLYTFNASHSDAFEGVEQVSKLPALRKLYDRMVNGNSYYSWPALSGLMKPALYFWMLILLAFSAVYVRTGRKWVYALYPVMYMLTCILGPTVNFRYIYPVLITLPFLYAVMIFDLRKSGDDSETSPAVND